MHALKQSHGVIAIEMVQEQRAHRNINVLRQVIVQDMAHKEVCVYFSLFRTPARCFDCCLAAIKPGDVPGQPLLLGMAGEEGRVLAAAAREIDDPQPTARSGGRERLDRARKMLADARQGIDAPQPAQRSFVVRSWQVRVIHAFWRERASH